MRGAVNPPRVALTTAVAAAAVLAGLLPGTPSAATGPDGAVELAYSCAFTPAAASDGTSPAAVTEDATVTVQQTYPATGAVGADIRPGALTVEVAFGKDAADAVLPAGATAATATAVLTARVTQGSSTADAQWPGLRAASTPATDGLDLTFTGDATALTVSAAGTVRFDASTLDLTVYAQTPPADTSSAPATPTPSGTTAPDATADAAPDAADSATPAAPDTAAAPLPSAAGTVSGTLTAACTPEDGQATQLGEVPVTGAATDTPTPAGSATAAPTTSATTTADGSAGTADRRGNLARHGTITLAGPPHSGVNDCPPAPTGEPDQDFLDSLPRPPNAFHIVVPPAGREAECAFITGLSNVGKLNGAATVNDLTAHPAITRIVQTGVWAAPGGIYLELDSVADMELPPAHSTFLTFGFMPTTATMTMTEVGPMTLAIVGRSGGYYTTTTTVVGKLDLSLSDVKVNGTPLDVGPNCHTVRPLDLRLTGLDKSHEKGHDNTLTPGDYNEIEGGPLFQDTLVIPPFTGCSAHGENVDALLTASISGPDNSLNFIQGGLCVPNPVSRPHSHCDPEIPYPTPPHR